MANFLIYGGCVSRDTFELVKDENTLVSYVARQSLISATSKPEARLDLTSFSSKFNSRMVKGDIQSSLLPTIRRVSQEVDIFLFDILSERLGVYRLSGGTYITNSVELNQSGLLVNSTVNKAIIPMGTETHYNLWKESASILKDTLLETGLFDKTFLLKSHWASVTVQGSTVPNFRDWDAARGNEIYEPYFEYLETLGFRTINPPLEISHSTDSHKWGPSPYHYQQEFYEYVLDALGVN